MCKALPLSLKIALQRGKSRSGRSFQPTVQWNSVRILKQAGHPPRSPGLPNPFKCLLWSTFSMHIKMATLNQDEFLDRKFPTAQWEKHSGQTTSSFPAYFDFYLFQHFLHKDLMYSVPPTPFKSQIPIYFNKISQKKMQFIQIRSSRNNPKNIP